MNKKILFTFLWTMVSFSIIFADTTIPGGYVSGTWTAAGSPYLIQDNITIHADSTLAIEPGVDVIFQGYYRLTASGILEAIGTTLDSIRFLPSDTSIGWHGLYFNGSGISHNLSFCTIEYAGESGIHMHAVALKLDVRHCTIAHCRSDFGGGIHVNGFADTLDISHTCFAYNTAESDTGGEGGGIYLRMGTLIMDSCMVHANRAVIPNEQYDYAVQGGGIYVGVGTAGVTISRSVISDNFIGLSNGGTSWGGYYDVGENGAGIYNRSEELVDITNCLIIGNRANVQYGGGGGISSEASSYLTAISHCNISNNWVGQSAVGGGFYGKGNANIVNCTFYANEQDAMALLGLFKTYNVENNIVAYNAHGIIFSLGWGSTLDIGFNNVTDNCTLMPTGFGVLDTMNANGDSCDVFFNIFKDPMFVDTANGDLHLLEDSPCIDAGNPSSPYDPDNTIADMGAFYFNQNPTVLKELKSAIPSEYISSQNYPNPFNHSTTISYQILSKTDVKIELYNILGERVKTLFSGEREAGNYMVNLDGSDLSSGVYYYRLTTEDFVDTKKCLLLK
jgi:hypothetical protein